MSRAAQAWKTLRWSVAQRGLGGTLRFAILALKRRLNPTADTAPSAHPFDAEHGTDTGGVIGGGNLGVGGRNDVHITAYAGVAPSRLRTALVRWQSALDEQTLADFSFVDLGCGKGRALMLASERPFREAVGVELNPGLAERAEQNLARWQEIGTAHCPVHVICGDATAFTLPPGPCLVFLYNPFRPPVIHAVLDGFARQRAGDRSPLYILFQNDSAENPMGEDARLQRLWSDPVALSAEDAAADPVASPEDLTSLYRWVN